MSAIVRLIPICNGCWTLAGLPKRGPLLIPVLVAEAETSVEASKKHDASHPQHLLEILLKSWV